jgi:hypothetical protein
MPRTLGLLIAILLAGCIQTLPPEGLRIWEATGHCAPDLVDSVKSCVRQTVRDQGRYQLDFGFTPDLYRESFIPCMNRKDWRLVEEHPWRDSLDLTRDAYHAWSRSVCR